MPNIVSSDKTHIHSLPSPPLLSLSLSHTHTHTHTHSHAYLIMDKTNAFLIGGMTLLDYKCLLPLLGVIPLCIVLIWITTLRHFYSCLWGLLQTIPHFLNIICKGTSSSTSHIHINTPSKPCPGLVNGEDGKLLRGEVALVMGKLGIFYDPDGDELQEIMGSEDIAALFEEKKPSLEEVQQAFDVFDENSDGFIDADELEKLLCRLSFKEVSEVECQRMIAAFDDNRDGLIDCREFAKLLESCSL